MKTILISVHNSLMEEAIIRMLSRSEDLQGRPVSPGGSVERECEAISADIVLMEATYDAGATLDDCLDVARAVRTRWPGCKVVVLCDENSAPEVARKVAMAKKAGAIDDFVYSSVSESYLTALLDAV